MKHEESHIQRACVRWFRLQYPELNNLLFAVPNGGGRSKIEAGILKAEGIKSGVSDLILLVSNRQYNALCIEMKSEKGRMSDAQKEWKESAEKFGSKYQVCRSIDEFMKAIKDYLP